MFQRNYSGVIARRRFLPTKQSPRDGFGSARSGIASQKPLAKTGAEQLPDMTDFLRATFEEYCKERWGMNRAHAYRLIDAAEVVNNLSPIGDIPANESQARPLTALRDNPELQRAAWERARKKRAVSFPCPSCTTSPRPHPTKRVFKSNSISGYQTIDKIQETCIIIYRIPTN